jgi:hypothetical protein
MKVNKPRSILAHNGILMTELSLMRVVCLGLILLLAGCANNMVESYVDVCCPEPGYRTFSVEAKHIPAFLGPIMVSNFNVAFASHGLQPMEEGGDLSVLLRFEQDDLTVPRPISDFDERIAPGGDVRFVARIAIEVTDVRTDKMIWSGGIHRLHDISPGEYMHTGRASVALLEAFKRALTDFPTQEPSLEN